MYRKIPSNGADNVKHFIDNLKSCYCCMIQAGPCPVRGKSQCLSLVLTFGMPAMAQWVKGCFHQAANKEISKQNRVYICTLCPHILMINNPFFTIPWCQLLFLTRMPFMVILTLLFFFLNYLILT